MIWATFSLPYLLGHILDDAVAVLLAEVDVYIRRVYALGVQKALKEQVVFNRVDFGDAKGVGHKTSCCRAAARPHRAAIVFCILDEIGNNEKIGRKLHLRDHLDFVFKPFAVDRGALVEIIGMGLPDFSKPLFKARAAHLLEIALVDFAFGRGESGEFVFTQGYFKIAALGNGYGVFEGLGHRGESPLHFIRRLEVKLLRGEAHAAGRVDGLAGLNAQQHFVGEGVAGVQIVAVIGCHQGRP